jgi:hypothetical protein
VNLEIFV